MQFYLISDNIDTQMGMRLAGIKGVVVHEEDEVRRELEKAVSDKNIAIILMTEKLVKLCYEMVYDIKLRRRSPLIVEIPDRHGTSEISENINRYVRDAIGLKI
ncbi:MAG: ATP synthase subunit F [Oscillospiraceae bacterium]|nr:ATP synthase subunit F [Oscillospiraceae bacterium]MDE5916710.1 V-type ATP synthase subunit F [Oscillospiraceae bacterium]